MSVNILRDNYLVQVAFCHSSSHTFARSITNAPTYRTIMKSANSMPRRESLVHPKKIGFHQITSIFTYFVVVVFSYFSYRVTPIVNVVQTFLNEDKLYHAIVDLPENMNFLGAITTIATHPKFSVLEGIFFFLRYFDMTNSKKTNDDSFLQQILQNCWIAWIRMDHQLIVRLISMASGRMAWHFRKREVCYVANHFHTAATFVSLIGYFIKRISMERIKMNWMPCQQNIANNSIWTSPVQTTEKLHGTTSNQLSRAKFCMVRSMLALNILWKM